MSVAEFPSQQGPGEFTRTPPQDVVAEQSVLGGMLLSKDAIADVVEAVRGHDFYRPAHELVFDAVLDLYGRGEPADAVTVSAELQKRGELARVTRLFERRTMRRVILPLRLSPVPAFCSHTRTMKLGFVTAILPELSLRRSPRRSRATKASTASRSCAGPSARPSADTPASRTSTSTDFTRRTGRRRQCARARKHGVASPAWATIRTRSIPIPKSREGRGRLISKRVIVRRGSLG